MTDLIKAVDVGVFTRPSVTPDQWRRARDDHGVALAIVGVWSGREHHPNPAPMSLQAAQEAGLATAIYTVTNARAGGWTVNHAIQLAREAKADTDALRFVALDVEVVGAPLHQAQFDDAVAAIHDLDLDPLVYTGKWYWDGGGDRHMDNPTWASNAGVPLWASIYDGRFNVDFPPAKRFGGWTQLYAKQYTSKGERQLGFLGDISAARAARPGS